MLTNPTIETLQALKLHGMIEARNGIECRLADDLRASCY